jgi:hypothetical protein
MQLLPNEERLVFSNQDQIVLTNQRIRLTNKEWGRSYQITIFLENISSIESLYKSNPLFAVLAGVGFLFGVMQLGQGQNDNGALIFGSFAAAIIFLILWLNSQRQVVIISSDGGSKLNFRTAGMAATQVQDFIDKVQAAQAKRIAELHKL